MIKFLKKIKLIETFSISLDITKQKFISELSKITDKNKLGFLNETFDSLEAFNSSRNEYKGIITEKGFEIKQKIKLFETRNLSPIAKGCFKEDANKLNIEINIYGINNISYFFITFYIIFNSILLFILIENKKIEFTPIFIGFTFSTFMLIIFYNTSKRSIQRFKYELEREFFYLTKY